MSVRVTVAKGRVVRDQRGRKCPNTEFSVNETEFFWAGLIRCGDLVRVMSQAAPVAPVAEKRADNK